MAILRNRGKLHNLTIRYGTLTEGKRLKIREHIVQTIIMLDALPLPDRLANVPKLAGMVRQPLGDKSAQEGGRLLIDD